MKSTSISQQNIMKRVKVIVLAVILLTIEVVVGVIINSKARYTATNEIINGYSESAKSISAELASAIKAGETLPKDLTTVMTKTENTYKMELNGKSYTVSVGEKIRADGFNVYTLIDMCDNITADDYIKNDKNVYAIYSTADGENTNLSFIKADRLTEGFKLFGFNGFALFTESKRAVYVNGTLSDGGLYGESYKGELPTDGVKVDNVEFNGNKYYFSLCRLENTKYVIGGYVNAAESGAALAQLSRVILLSFIALGAVTIACVVLLSYLPDKKGGRDFRYKMVTDVNGRILKSNVDFRRDYPDATSVKERVNAFDENKSYAITMNGVDDNSVFACNVNKCVNGTVEINAEKLNMPYGTDISAVQVDTMENVYKSLAHQPQLFVGELFFENLHDIKVIFGKDFAEQARLSLVARIREKFEYVYQLDYYHVGVIQPDGKKYKETMRDLPNYVEYFNKVLKIDDNNIIKVVVKCGFAIVDSIMKNRSYEYVMNCAEAALRRSCEPQSDPLLKTDFYMYNESQRKLYEKYFFRIDIPAMLEHGDFYLEYQPQYSVRENKIVAFEALFRVKQGAQLHASTADIIAFAEQSGYMILLGDFIFNTGMAFAKSIEGMGVSVSLNVSLIQFMQFGFVDHFMQLYNSYELKPGSISVEITESYLVRTLDETIQKLNILKANGIGIHLDDFGTAYSSFNYLKELPISAIKVDQIFVRDIEKNKHSELISSIIIDLSEHLNIHSICEGVETKEQLDILKKHNVDIIQGYLISKSVDSETARKMITEYKYEE